MMSLRSLFSFLVLLVCFVAATKAKKDDDENAQAIRDMEIGLAGLKEAQNNPALLAQLMRDLQDPELMAEAKKMMDRPEYQAQMKKMSNSKEFKDGLKKSGEMMKDPAKAAATEAKLEHMVKVGNDELKKGASNVMEDAMDAMNNPEVMAEMTKMIKDPQFQEQLAAMAKDPSFKSYVDAMQDMMKDPEKKKQMDAMAAQMRASV